MNSKYVELGHSAGAHGVKGAVSIKLINPDDSVLKKGLKVLLKGNASKSTLPPQGQFFKINNIQFGNKVIVSFEDITDRNQLEGILPFSLMVDRELFPKVHDGEIYLVDLIGMKVVNPKGKSVGVVKGTFNHGSVDIITIELKSGEDLDLPFTQDFFTKIDMDNGLIEISDVEYL